MNYPIEDIPKSETLFNSVEEIELKDNEDIVQYSLNTIKNNPLLIYGAGSLKQLLLER